MNNFRIVLRDFDFSRRIKRSWWRNYIDNNAWRKGKRMAVRFVLQSLKANLFLKPRRSLLLSALATIHAAENVKNNITDDELKALITDVDTINNLVETTLYCKVCKKRVPIDNKKQPGISYCTCATPTVSKASSDGWEPFMEADDVVMWKREYRKGSGLFAYKVYGRYTDAQAKDFAAIQLDTAYRRSWDDAVADLNVVEKDFNETPGQALLHWVVLWPRFFSNRDYVYLRRQKDFAVTNNASSESITKELTSDSKKQSNKVYAIISRSFVTDKVPEESSNIRVKDYWSHMVVRSLHGDDKPGMEFVLTYYDDPGGSGMPSGVASWATGRAAPAFLAKQRQAAKDYDKYLKANKRVPTSFAQTVSQTKDEDSDEIKKSPVLVPFESETDLGQAEKDLAPALTNDDDIVKLHDVSDKGTVTDLKPVSNKISVEDKAVQTNGDLSEKGYSRNELINIEKRRHSTELSEVFYSKIQEFLDRTKEVLSKEDVSKEKPDKSHLFEVVSRKVSEIFGAGGKVYNKYDQIDPKSYSDNDDSKKSSSDDLKNIGDLKSDEKVEDVNFDNSIKRISVEKLSIRPQSDVNSQDNEENVDNESNVNENKFDVKPEAKDDIKTNVDAKDDTKIDNDAEHDVKTDINAKDDVNPDIDIKDGEKSNIDAKDDAQTAVNAKNDEKIDPDVVSSKAGATKNVKNDEKTEQNEINEATANGGSPKKNDEENDDEEKSTSWYKYIFPFSYFV